MKDLTTTKYKTKCRSSSNNNNDKSSKSSSKNISTTNISKTIRKVHY